MSDTILHALADSSLRVSLVAAFVALILAALRARSSGARHAAWRAVLGAMLLMPILPYCVPSFTFPLPASFRGIATIFGTPETSPQAFAVPFPVESPQEIELPEHAAPTSRAPVSPGGSEREPVWSTLALVLYGMGTMILLSRLLLGWRSARRIALAGRRIDPMKQRQAVREWPGEVPLCESESVTTPVTVGVTQPTTILPVNWSLWSDEKLRAVLIHELAHVRRRDPLVGFLAQLNLCLYWFHPLAWWLKRKLAVTAEHACDDAAVRALGETRRYAEVLIEMAEAVRKGGRRVSWQRVGIDGSGLLGERIDRILSGDLFRELSSARKVVLAVACGAAILAVAACRQPPASPLPLQQDPGVSEERDRSRAEREFERAAREMTPQEVADLEALLTRNPEDLASRQKLLIFYWSALSGEKAPGDEQKIAARRAHILWLIEHQPESDLAGSVEARLFPTGPDSLVDPVGYRRTRELWLAHTRTPEGSAVALGNASSFFEGVDNPLAERMLLRAQSRDPTGPWSSRLGRFYAVVLVGAYARRSAHVLRPVSVAEPESPYAQTVRKKLGESTDDVLLTAAAESLLHSTRTSSRVDLDAERIASSCLERALGLNPESIHANTERLTLRARQRTDRIHRLLRDVPPISQYEALSRLPEADRFELLPDLALGAFGAAESAAGFDDPNLQDYIKTKRELSGKYAQDLLGLAPSYLGHSRHGTAIYRAHMTLGALALREGDKKAAIEHMLNASRAPASEELVYSRGIAAGPLLPDLLKHGERESVIDFLERMAQKNIAERATLREAAAAIRGGRMPRFPHWTMGYH